jgi:AraC-like DNA-binding protein
MVLRLFIFYKKSNINTLMLALALFCVWHGVLTSYLNETRLILHFPFLIRTGIFTGYLIAPFLYLYVRNSFYPGIFWKNTDWLLLVPSLIYLIDLLPFFISSPELKIAIFNSSLNDSSRYFRVKEGWIGLTGFHFSFVYIWSFMLQALQVRMIFLNRDVKDRKEASENKHLFWFLVIITLCYLPLSVPGLFGILMHLQWFTMHYVSLSLSIVLLATTLYLFYYPDIIYGFGPRPTARDLVGSTADQDWKARDLIGKSFDQAEKDGSPATIEPALISVEESSLASLPASKGYIKRTDFLDIIAKLEIYIADKTPYLDQRYSIHDLAGDVGIPVYQLSPIINRYYHDNFNAWLNKFRVDYFIRLWEDKGNRELTIDALARKSGFSNRITFINAFKKEKKTTPTMYLKK